MQISGDIVLIKGDEKHSGKWNIGMAVKFYRGQNVVIRAVGLRTLKIVYSAFNSVLVPT